MQVKIKGHPLDRIARCGCGAYCRFDWLGGSYLDIRELEDNAMSDCFVSISCNADDTAREINSPLPQTSNTIGRQVLLELGVNG
jgi:hypothetical protein